MLLIPVLRSSFEGFVDFNGAQSAPMVRLVLDDELLLLVSCRTFWSNETRSISSKISFFCKSSIFLPLIARLGFFFCNFSFHLLPRWDSNPRCTRLGPLKDALPTELRRRGKYSVLVTISGFLDFRFWSVRFSRWRCTRRSWRASCSSWRRSTARRSGTSARAATSSARSWRGTARWEPSCLKSRASYSCQL